MSVTRTQLGEGTSDTQATVGYNTALFKAVTKTQFYFLTCATETTHIALASELNLSPKFSQGAVNFTSCTDRLGDAVRSDVDFLFLLNLKKRTKTPAGNVTETRCSFTRHKERRFV